MSEEKKEILKKEDIFALAIGNYSLILIPKDLKATPIAFPIEYEKDATDLIQLATYSSGSEVPVGFISCIILPENQLDIAAFVDPSYRQIGIFTAMVKELLKKKYMKN